MRGFAEERAGEFDAAVGSYDEALRLDARDKVTWNSKGLALVHLKRFDEALRAFDAALALDPAYEPAQSGKKTAEERIHIAKIEGFAEAVVRFEKHLARPATRDEVFRYCSVPLEDLDEVIAYVNEPAPLAPDRIEAGDLRRYEAVGAAVLRTVENAKNLNTLRLTDVSAVLPHVDLEEARTIWGYIDWVRDAPLEPTAEWHNDELIRQAMDLPKEEWNLVDLAKELHLGPFEAKKLEVSLKIFEGGAYKISTDRKSTRLNSSHRTISYAVFCLKKKKRKVNQPSYTQPSTPHYTLTTNFTQTLLLYNFSHITYRLQATTDLSTPLPPRSCTMPYS